MTGALEVHEAHHDQEIAHMKTLSRRIEARVDDLWGIGQGLADVGSVAKMCDSGSILRDNGWRLVIVLYQEVKHNKQRCQSN